MFKVYPKDVNVDVNRFLEEIRNAIPKECTLKDYSIEEIGFGIKILRIGVLMPEDIEGGTSKVEESIKALDIVSEVEVEYVTRM